MRSELLATPAKDLTAWAVPAERAGANAMKWNRSGESTQPSDLTRRRFVKLSAGAAALSIFRWPESANGQATDGENRGQVVHLIPTASA